MNSQDKSKDLPLILGGSGKTGRRIAERMTALRSTIGEYAEVGSTAVNFQADQTSIDALYTDIWSTFSTRTGLAGERILQCLQTP